MTYLKTRAVEPDLIAGPSSNQRRWFGSGMIFLGLGVATSALLGPLMLGVIEYHASQGAIDQLTGGDAAALFLVAPVSIVAGILALRGHRAAPVIAMGPAVFAVYTYTQLTLGGDFVRYPGNSEDFFLLNLGLFVTGGLMAITAWTAIDPNRLPRTSSRFDRILGSILLAAAVFLLFGLHVPHLMELWGGELSDAYLADPGVYWLVKLMDLGIMVPAMIGVGIGLLRHRVWAQRAKYGVVGWFALLGSSVAGMAIVMQINQDASASLANTIGFGTFALLGLALASILYRPLFTGVTEPVESVRRPMR
jgi:hypothetical protein